VLLFVGDYFFIYNLGLLKCNEWDPGCGVGVNIEEERQCSGIKTFISIPTMDKQRKHCEAYLKYGFTSTVSNGFEKPQCVLCNVGLRAELCLRYPGS